MSSTVSGRSGTEIAGDRPRLWSSRATARMWNALLPVKLQWLTKSTFTSSNRLGDVAAGDRLEVRVVERVASKRGDPPVAEKCRVQRTTALIGGVRYTSDQCPGRDDVPESMR